MQQFISANDVKDVPALINEGIALKNSKDGHTIGKGKTLGLIFFNPSLRTRLSSQRAGYNLGMNVIVMDIGKDGWKIEMQDGAVMNGGTQEHIKDAVQAMSQYVDILGVRTFASLTDKEADYKEKVMSAFVKYATVPVVSLESATLHPLQSLADMITIQEQKITKPRVVLTWAPHPKALPQAVANSFLQWIKYTDADVTLACPAGYELAEEFISGINVVDDQNEALKDADFVYAKNWSGYKDYGSVGADQSWMVTREKMNLTHSGKFMHCLPIRRNVVADDAVIDNSLVYRQAQNRIYAAQVVLKKILET